MAILASSVVGASIIIGSVAVVGRRWQMPDQNREKIVDLEAVDDEMDMCIDAHERKITILERDLEHLTAIQAEMRVEQKEMRRETTEKLDAILRMVQ